MYYNKSHRTEVRRRPDRAVYERAQIEAILDEAFLCHVGFPAGGTSAVGPAGVPAVAPSGVPTVASGGAPVVIPMIYGRAGDTLYLHGSPASRLLKGLPAQAGACATVTLIDGLVLARAARKHSLNYRSVVAFGCVRAIDDPAEKLTALETIVDHLLPGRSREARAPTPHEVHTTNVVAFAIEEASAKVRSGPPADDEADLAHPIWAGEVPLRLGTGPPAPHGRSADLPLPGSLSAFMR